MGERANLPFTEKMATGEIFVGKPLEQDIALGMTKGPSAATIAGGVSAWGLVTVTAALTTALLV